MTRAQWRKHIALPCFEDIGRWKLERYPQAWGYQWLRWCINFPLICFLALFTPSFYDFSHTFVYKLRSKRWLSSDHAGMNKISCEVSIFYLNSDWKIFYIVGKGKFREVHYYSHSALDCCPHGRSSKKSILAYGDTKKKRIGLNPN